MADEIKEEVTEETPEEAVVEEVVEETVDTTDGILNKGTVEAPEKEPVEAPVEEAINPDDYKIETRGGTKKPIEYGEDIDPDDVKTIGSIVEKQTASDRAENQALKDRIEVSEFVQDNPQFSKYKGVVLKHMRESPDVYGRLPVKNVFAMLASKDLMSIGASKEREAQAKVAATKTKGTQVRKPNAGATDWSRVPKDEFETQKRKVLGQHM